MQVFEFTPQPCQRDACPYCGSTQLTVFGPAWHQLRQCNECRQLSIYTRRGTPYVPKLQWLRTAPRRMDQAREIGQ